MSLGTVWAGFGDQVGLCQENKGWKTFPGWGSLCKEKYEAVCCIQKTRTCGIWERFRSWEAGLGLEQLAGPVRLGREKLTLRTRGNPCSLPEEKEVFRSVFQDLSSHHRWMPGRRQSFPCFRRDATWES